MRAHLLQLILRKVLQEGLRVSKQKLPSLNYGGETERLSRNGSQASARSATVDECKAQNTTFTTDDKSTECSTLDGGTEEMTDTQCNTQLADRTGSALL
ncbi:unnamed protein product [Prunus armeniaca]|uniref:Uncharacterized protein n=1 Tax=Prunus armeniaca TaxID=36596 RepID=A0A6J5XZL2_PRUAR|nr:unnamed protein product [Prunus armeniaca]CAB4316638.1 unnamed protein product [Prunus armeniaca]